MCSSNPYLSRVNCILSMFSSTEMPMYSQCLWQGLAWNGPLIYAHQTKLERTKMCWPQSAQQENFVAVKTKKGGMGNGRILIRKESLLSRKTTLSTSTLRHTLKIPASSCFFPPPPIRNICFSLLKRGFDSLLHLSSISKKILISFSKRRCALRTPFVNEGLLAIGERNPNSKVQTKREISSWKYKSQG